jgi:hypothetical protein
VAWIGYSCCWSSGGIRRGRKERLFRQHSEQRKREREREREKEREIREPYIIGSDALAAAAT